MQITVHCYPLPSFVARELNSYVPASLLYLNSREFFRAPFRRGTWARIVSGIIWSQYCSRLFAKTEIRVYLWLRSWDSGPKTVIKLSRARKMGDDGHIVTDVPACKKYLSTETEWGIEEVYAYGVKAGATVEMKYDAGAVDGVGGEGLCVRRKKTDSPPPVNKILRVLPLAPQSLNPIPGPSFPSPPRNESERTLLTSRRWKALFFCALLSSGYTFLASVLRTEYQFTRGAFSTLLHPASTFVVEYGRPLVPIF